MDVEDFTETLGIQDTMKIGCRVWSATKYTSIILVLLIREILITMTWSEISHAHHVSSELTGDC